MCSPRRVRFFHQKRNVGSTKHKIKYLSCRGTQYLVAVDQHGVLHIPARCIAHSERGVLPTLTRCITHCSYGQPIEIKRFFGGLNFLTDIYNESNGPPAFASATSALGGLGLLDQAGNLGGRKRITTSVPIATCRKFRTDLPQTSAVSSLRVPAV